MLQMIWPIAMVVLANCVYHICAKATPSSANAFLSLTVTYAIAAVVSFILFLFTGMGEGLLQEFKKLNWVSYVLGGALVALEFGYICVYRAGWKVGVGSLVANICLAVVLAIVGVLIFKESISIKQIIGMVICAGGLILVTK